MTPAVPSPENVFRTLNEHDVRYVVVGGIAALMHSSPYPTFDTDICAETSSSNLEHLADALRAMDARIFTEAEPEGLPFSPNPAFLAENPILNMITRYGRVDLIAKPAGSDGYPDLARDAVTVEIDELRVSVASLADVIRTKAAVTSRDDPSLPVLREILARTRGKDQKR